MRTLSYLPLGLLLAAAIVASADAADARKYTLRYKFHDGETLRWQVAHRNNTRTSVSGTTKNAETSSKSVKLWRVKEVKSDGSAVFEHLVENVDMRHQMTGHPEVRYNSRTDKKPPTGYQQVAKSVGVPLSKITMDVRGRVVRRDKKVEQSKENPGCITVPLPEEPIPIGHTWSFPHEIQAKLNSGGIKRIKALQTFTLKRVKTGVATIDVATRILTPIQDPALESQVMQYRSRGTVRFDIDAGRVLGQQMDVDQHVVGFSGQASSLHYLNRFTEELLRGPVRTAGRSTQGSKR